MDWQKQKVLIIGLGKSGLAASKALAALGANVIACDQKKMVDLDLSGLDGFAVQIISGGYPDVARIRPDLIITSPGVPPWVPPLIQAGELGIPIWAELELAYRLLPERVKLIAITGSNGKTTTTALTGQVLLDAGLRVTVAGNIGIPLVEKVREIQPGDFVVCEASSFQLETAVAFHPYIAVILNITPDHLDRHGTFERYRLAKEQIFSRQGSGDITILNYDDPETRSLAPKVPGGVFFFSRQSRLQQGVYVQEGQIVLDLGKGPEPICPTASLALPGSHNLENSLAVVAVAGVLGLDRDSLVQTLKNFPGVPHRLEPVAEIAGVRYINDSKGTNPEATIKALEAYDEPIVLIAGGYDKGSDFGLLAEKMKGKVKHLILIGETAPRISRAASKAGLSSICLAESLAAAVTQAARLADRGDIVLLSPACASWDMFRNYEERGEIFKKMVKAMEGGK